jgi:hypothetical protein
MNSLLVVEEKDTESAQDKTAIAEDKLSDYFLDWTES